MARDRLVPAAILGGLRQGSFAVLILLAFAVLAGACAAGPMFGEASANAAFQARRDAVPVTARQDDSAVVRLSADTGASVDQRPVVDDLRSVEGLGAPALIGGSVGAELAEGTFWESTAGAGDRTARARLFAVETPAAELTPIGTPTGTGGVWVPEPVAAELGVRPGDPIVVTVGLGIDGDRKRAETPVSGIYAVDAGGRLPADRPGERTWALRRFDTPVDTEFETLPAHLLIGDIATVERLAATVEDQILWSAEAALMPGATLAEARRAAGGVERLRRTYASSVPAEGEDPLSLRFASGIGRIAATAEATTAAVRQRTRPVEWAAIAIGLGSVLAVGLLSVRRRDREIRHTAAVGIPALTTGGHWALEHLLPALLGAGAGWLAAWQIVVRFGPPGTLAESLRPAAVAAGAAALAGIATVAGVATVVAARRVRPAPPAMPRRALPWGLLVVVAAVVAAAGLVGAGAGGARGVDLLVPLLVLAAAGVVAGGIPARLGSSRRSGSPRRLPPARAALWLARRRLGAGGAERRLVVTVLTAGLGMLLFALSALESSAVSADDRVAVAAGAEAVATINGSWELDPAAPPVPPPPPDNEPLSRAPVPGVRTPPLPPGNTMVWRTDFTTPLDNTQRDLMIVDPATFAGVALWGHGSDLAAARTAVAGLGLATAPADPDTPIPAIAVADPAAHGLTTLLAPIGNDTRPLDVTARVPAFPGLAGRPMWVVSADDVFATAGAADPRLRPRSRLDMSALFMQTFLWNASGAAGIAATTAPTGTTPERVSTAAEVRQGDAYVATRRARGYQLAVAAYLALLAVLTLGVYAQRTAAARRPADLMLARIGLGRSRIRWAGAAEFALLAGIALGAAVAGVAALALLGGRLLDDQPGLPPAFEFRQPPVALAVTAGVALVATLLAVGLTTVRSRRAEEDAYRDD